MKTSQYSSIIKNHEVKPSYIKDTASAFFFGGLVCVVGQGFYWLYNTVFNIDDQTASTYMIVTMILIATLLTGLGIYDKFGQLAKAGGFVLITGFANSLTSSALEGKSEGLILGIATNMFKLAGSVIVIAVISAFAFGILRYFLATLGIVPALDEGTVNLVMGVLL